jgi:hypothetical protein
MLSVQFEATTNGTSSTPQPLFRDRVPVSVDRFKCGAGGSTSPLFVAHGLALLDRGSVGIDHMHGARSQAR